MRRTLLLALAFIALSNVYAQTRLGLHFTQEELDIWKKRAVSGPYRVQGDVQTNSPGDWTRIVSNANTFIANPTADRWVGYPGSGCFPASTTVSYEPNERGVRLQNAAFVWLVTGDNKYINAVKTELLWHAQNPLLNFTNASRWCLMGEKNPSFNISEWLMRMLFTYDYVKNQFTPAERATMDNWILGAGNFYAKNVDWYYRAGFADRLNGDYTLTAYSIIGERDNFKQLMYFGSTPVGFMGMRYNNRICTQIRFIGTAGIFLDNENLKTCAKRWFFEWLRFGVYPSMDIADLHRCVANPSAEPERGLLYSFGMAQAMSDLADAFARNGDNSLYEYSTTEGYFGSASPGNPKSLLKVIQNLQKYLNGTHKRYASTTPTTNPNQLINGVDPYANPGEITYDTWFCVANHYYKTNFIRTNYLRQDAGSRPYPKWPRSIGPNQPWGGHAAIYPGTLFMFGQLEEATDPYSDGTVVLPAQPVITVNGNKEFCQGGSVVLSAPQGFKAYRWSNGAITQKITVSMAGSYTVKVTDQAGNDSAESDEVTISVKPLPIQPAIVATGNTNICNGESVLLNGGAGQEYTYQWKKDGINITNATDSIYTAIQSGSYTITIAQNGCSSTPSSPMVVNVTAVPKPTITASGNTSFNVGDSVVLNSSTGTGFSYQWQKNGIDIPGATSNNYTATQEGAYTVQTFQNGCQSDISAPITVKVSSLTQSSAFPDGSVNFCEGGSVVLSANEGTNLTYQWRKNGVDIPDANASTYTATTSGSYTVVVSQAGTPLLPSTPITVTVTARINPTVTSAGPVTFCTGGSVTLQATKRSGLSYRWKKNGNLIPNATSADYVANQSGNYSVEVTQQNCLASISNSITVMVNKTATPVITAAGSTVFCTGGSVVLKATIGSGMTYRWKKDGVLIQNATSSDYSATQSGKYTVEVLQNNCSSSQSNAIVVVVNTTYQPIISTTNNTVLCEETAILLSAPVETGLTYQWKKDGINIPNERDANLLVNEAGTYSVMATQSTCGSALSNEIVVTNSLVEKPSAIISATGSTNICAGNTVALKANTGAELTYQWLLNDEIIPNATKATFDATQSGDYTVTVTKSDCKSTVSNTITVSVAQLATKPTISANGSTTISEGESVTLSTAQASGITYQWRKNNVTIPNATTRLYTVTQSGSYTLAIVKDNCQQAISNEIAVVVKTTNKLTVTPTGSTTFCEGGSVKLTAAEGYTTYKWSNGATTKSITVGKSGEFTVTAYKGSNSATVTSKAIKVVVIERPKEPTVQQQNNTLVANQGFSYQWFMDGNAMKGANFQTLTITQAGEYSVMVTNANGCATISKEMHASAETVSTPPNTSLKGEGLIIYPNPAKSELQMALLGENTEIKPENEVRISFVNTHGIIIKQEILVGLSQNFHQKVDVSALPFGLYILKIQVDGKIFTKRFIKE